MRMRLISLSLALLWTAAVSAAPAPALDEALDWIGRMNKAVVDRNYDGVVRHTTGGGVELLRIIHGLRDGRMVERVIYLDDSGHEQIRDGSQLITFYPEKRIALVETQNRRHGYFTALNGLTAASAKFYNITNHGIRELKGYNKPTQQVSVLPRDALRYGYVFWLDRQTAMPIKTQLVTSEGRVIEEFSFKNLFLLESISDELLTPDEGTRDYHKMRLGVSAGEVKQAFVPRDNLLPEGFHVVLSSPSAVDGQAKGPNTRFIVSDGIAWASVVVDVATKPMKLGPGQMDALAGHVIRLGDHYISVMGEVPPAAVKAIAEAVRPE
jgi:sigma-E factor negative regulatory protein RseB